MIAALRTPRGLATALLLLILAVLPLLTQAFDQRYLLSIGTRIVIWSIAAVSLNMILGYGGLVSFGHAVFFGIGGYTVGILAANGLQSGWLQWPVAIAASVLWAALVGALSLRTRGVYFIMVTLAFSQMAFYVVHDTPLGGGTDGIYLTNKPMLGTLLDLDRPLAMYAFTLACLLLVFAFLALVLRSRFGRALAGIRVNEQRMRATGFSTYPYKLAAFVISGAIAGLAGFLFAVKDGFVNPELMSWHLSGEVLIMIILGGLGHLRGALLGAFAFAMLQEFFKSEAVFGDFAKHWHLGLGLSIILSVALLPRGLVDVPQQILLRLLGPRPKPPGTAAPKDSS